MIPTFQEFLKRYTPDIGDEEHLTKLLCLGLKAERMKNDPNKNFAMYELDREAKRKAQGI